MMPEGHVPGTSPQRKGQLGFRVHTCGGGVRGAGHLQPLGYSKAEKPTAVGPFPLSFCISAGAPLS